MTPITDEAENLVSMLVQAAREREAASRMPDCIKGADERLQQARNAVLMAMRPAPPIMGVEEMVERAVQAIAADSDYDLSAMLCERYARAALEASGLLTEIERLREALEPFSLLAGGDVNMNDPLRKWFSVAQLQDARSRLSTPLVTGQPK